MLNPIEVAKRAHTGAYLARPIRESAVFWSD